MKRWAIRALWRATDGVYQGVYRLSRGRWGYAPYSRTWNWLLAEADFYGVGDPHA